MLSNMATSLILHKRITTTVAKAKALRKFVEPIITKSKSNTTHSRRVVFSYLQDKEAINELFTTVADKVANRPGGYTRIIRTGYRLGDNAETCMMELVDFNELLLSESKPATTKKRRTRRAGKKAEGAEQVEAKASKNEAADAAPEVKAEEPSTNNTESEDKE